MKMTEPARARKRLDFRPTKGLKFEPLEESLQMRKLYIRGIRHDINGLLTPQISMSDYYGSLDEKTAARLFSQIKKFHRGSKAVFDQITKLTAMMADLQLREKIDLPFDPGDEVERAILSLTYSNGSASIDKSLGHTRPICGNPLDLYRALMNILFNAHDALGPGGRISIISKDRSLNKDHYVSISIGDNGTGMDAKTLEEVLKPGVTTKETGQGLGLFVVQHSIASFGGLIDIESEIGKGTKFTLLIPASISA